MVNKLVCGLVLCTALFVSCKDNPKIPEKPSNTKSVEAQRLLQFMKDNTGVKMLSGASATVNWNLNESEWVYKHTGKYPAINGFDYLHDQYSMPGGWIDYGNLSPATTWVDNNGVVAAMWHWAMLKNDGSSHTCSPGTEPDKTSFRPSAVMDPNSEDYKILLEGIDRIAAWMKPLKYLKIPILWRPLHEAQGNWRENAKEEWRKAWFWWGIDGPEVFVRLWRMMYDRMVNYHGLTNLIWVFTAGDSLRWYPGDEYVDIVSYDFYNSSMDDMINTYNFMKKTYPGKLMAISECGNIPKLSEQWKNGLYWNYFMPWWDNERTKDPNSQEFNSREHENFNIEMWEDALSCEFMLTRDELPSFRDN